MQPYHLGRQHLKFNERHRFCNANWYLMYFFVFSKSIENVVIDRNSVPDLTCMRLGIGSGPKSTAQHTSSMNR